MLCIKLLNEALVNSCGTQKGMPGHFVNEIVLQGVGTSAENHIK